MSGRRLGPDFTRLLAATVCSNLGDGTRSAAGPLLVASVTTDPVLVGAAVFVQQLPWLLASLPIGGWVDRLDRRQLIVAVDLARAVIVGLLTAAIALGVVNLPALYVVLLLIGTAEVVADNASAAFVPAVVTDAALPRANAGLSAAITVGNQFAGPPAGAWLFALGPAWPFGSEAVTFAAAALLIAGIRRRPAQSERDARQRKWLRRDIREGVRWLSHEPPVRLLALVLAVMNVTFSAAFATWVLYTRQRLGVSPTGFGLLLTAGAVGGLIGAATAGRLSDRFGSPTLLRAGLLTETGVLAALALARNPWVAGAVMVAFGAHAAIWGVIAATVRQRLVPDRLRGRVASVYFLLTMGGSALGALAGGGLADALGLTGPFWLAAGGDIVLIAAVWNRLGIVQLDPPDAAPQT